MKKDAKKFEEASERSMVKKVGKKAVKKLLEK